MTERFGYSSKRVKQQKRAGILMGGLLSTACPVYIAVADPEIVTDVGVGGMLIVFAFFFVVTTGSFAVVVAFAAKRWKALEVRILRDRIEHQSGRAVDRLTYESIKQVVVGKDRSGKTVYVRLYAPTSVMYLSGLSRMNKVVRSIGRRIPDAIEGREKRVWLDWSDPITAALATG